MDYPSVPVASPDAALEKIHINPKQIDRRDHHQVGYASTRDLLWLEREVGEHQVSLAPGDGLIQVVCRDWVVLVEQVLEILDAPHVVVYEDNSRPLRMRRLHLPPTPVAQVGHTRMIRQDIDSGTK